MLRLSSKQKKIIAGIGIAGGIGAVLLFLKNKMGFGDTPVELWKRGNNNVAASRKTIANLQAEARQSKRQAAVAAEQKRERESAAEQAEWVRREAIWKHNRKMIDALET